MSLTVREPAPPLAPFVSMFVHYQACSASVREVLLPRGAMLLVVNLGDDDAHWYDGLGFTTAHSARDAVLVAPGAGRICVDLAELRSLIGVLFRPGGAFPFFREPASAIDRPIVELDALWGTHSGLVRERLKAEPTPEAALSTLQRILVERLIRPLRPDPGIAWAAEALNAGVAVAAVADGLGVTDRTLLRRFTAQVGLTPKVFGRVGRLQRLLAWIRVDGEVDWARAAAECGYFDQAHLVNEFRALTGLTPTTYRPRSALCRNHEEPVR